MIKTRALSRDLVSETVFRHIRSEFASWSAQVLHTNTRSVRTLLGRGCTAVARSPGDVIGAVSLLVHDSRTSHLSVGSALLGPLSLR